MSETEAFICFFNQLKSYGSDARKGDEGEHEQDEAAICKK